MNSKSIAPCGLICDLCLYFQREKNRCVGCNGKGDKPHYCTVCKIILCPEKNGNEKKLCNKCSKFPCIKMKILNKRYSQKYGESNIQNFQLINQIGIIPFINEEKKKWICAGCGKLLCVHRDKCSFCETVNPNYPSSIK